MPDLTRASSAYRAGYRDGHAELPSRAKLPGLFDSPFGAGDYRDGYHAGQNDLKWERAYSERIKHSFNR